MTEGTKQPTQSTQKLPDLPIHDLRYLADLLRRHTHDGIETEETGAYVKLYNRRLETATDTISAVIKAKTYLRVVVSCPGVAASSLLRIRFNSDSGNNYNYNTKVNNAAGTGTAATDYLNLEAAINTNRRYFVFDILNHAAYQKEMVGRGMQSTTNNIEIMGEWTNTTSQITRIDLWAWDGAANQNMNAGTTLAVFGTN